MPLEKSPKGNERSNMPLEKSPKCILTSKYAFRVISKRK
jgi:hypothetical protein